MTKFHFESMIGALSYGLVIRATRLTKGADDSEGLQPVIH